MQSRLAVKTLTAMVLAAARLAGVGQGAQAGSAGPCPPGLAKRGSCVPPGQQKKWARGDTIPADADYRVIARHRDYRLPPPGAGQIYIESGRDIYLIAEATKRVIEAVNLVKKATQ